jgi:hypothetical protein
MLLCGMLLTVAVCPTAQRIRMLPHLPQRAEVQHLGVLLGTLWLQRRPSIW